MGWNILRRFIAIIIVLMPLFKVYAQILPGQNVVQWASKQFNAQSQQLAAKYPALLSPFDENLPRLDAEAIALVQQILSTTRKNWLQSVIDSSHTFRFLIQARMALYRMPRVVFYVPFAESEFVINALSRSGAAGIWQFMPESSKGYLVIEPNYDERFDFIKASDAALRKLSQNYSAIGDWPLAIAAYNAGLGSVQRSLLQTSDKSFSGLAKAGLLRKETAEYVPKILAFMWIAEQAGRLGMRLTWRDAVLWDAVILDRVPAFSLLEKQFELLPRTLSLNNQAWRFSSMFENQKQKFPMYAARPVVDHILKQLKKND